MEGLPDLTGVLNRVAVTRARGRILPRRFLSVLARVEAGEVDRGSGGAAGEEIEAMVEVREAVLEAVLEGRVGEVGRRRERGG